MSSLSLISDRRNAKLLFLFAGFSALLLATFVAVAEELPRAKAADLISASLGYPKHEEVVIQKRYKIKSERIKKWYSGSSGQARPGVCPYYNGPEFTKAQGVLDSLREKGLLTIGDEKLQGDNCITDVARIELTGTGQQYLLKETEREYTLRASDIVVDQVTGIIRAKGSVSAMAEYTESRKDKTPFFDILDSWGRPHHFKTKKASFLLYDDGWRAKR